MGAIVKGSIVGRRDTASIRKSVIARVIVVRGEFAIARILLNWTMELFCRPLKLYWPLLRWPLKPLLAAKPLGHPLACHQPQTHLPGTSFDEVGNDEKVEEGMVEDDVNDS